MEIPKIFIQLGIKSRIKYAVFILKREYEGVLLLLPTMECQRRGKSNRCGSFCCPVKLKKYRHQLIAVTLAIRATIGMFKLASLYKQTIMTHFR